MSMVKKPPPNNSKFVVSNPTTICLWPHEFSLHEVIDGLESMKEHMVNGERQNRAFKKTFGVKYLSPLIAPRDDHAAGHCDMEHTDVFPPLTQKEESNVGENDNTMDDIQDSDLIDQTKDNSVFGIMLGTLWNLDAEHHQEHIELTCTLHEMESHPLMILGWELGWPTTLDAMKIKMQIHLMKELCHEVIIHARHMEQFLGILELLEVKEPDLVDPPTPLSSYIWLPGYLRSAG
ncbi:hypothetical protein K439DRAFT_1621363 [Ramaria rubella]|nr:hypothetical protein K439DRAFT_1621363 [Ramaria rubella]